MVRRGDVYYCDLSPVVGSEQGGIRPVVIIQNDNEKIKGLNAIMKQTTSKAEWNYGNEMLEAVAVFRLDVAKLSCKAK